MKRLFIIALLILFASPAFAGDKVTLSKTENLSIPVASKLEVAHIIINLDAQRVDVVYRWLDATGQPIKLHSGSEMAWSCSGQCFTDTYEYIIKNADVGYGLGITLRDLLWQEMGETVVSNDNSGEFDKKKVK